MRHHALFTSEGRGAWPDSWYHPWFACALRHTPCHLTPGGSLDQVRLVTEAIRHRLLGWWDHRFGMRLGGHLGVREFDTAFQQPRLSGIALVERLPVLFIAVQRGALHWGILYMNRR